MEYLVAASPEECLNSAALYMVDKGYAVDSRDNSTMTLSRRPELGGGFIAIVLIASLFTFGVALAALAFVYLIKWKVTVLALPGEGRQTRLAVNGSHPKAERTLKAWVTEEFRGRVRAV